MQLDGNSTLLIALGIIALVAIVYAVRYGGSGKTKITGPLGMSVEAEGRTAPKTTPKESNKPPPAPAPAAVDLDDVKAGGGVYADAEGSIKMKKIDAGDDVIASSKQPPQGNDAPKA